jgi:hypothetical protein
MYMRNHHKKTVQSGGAAPDGKIHFPLMKKGEIFIRCRGRRHGSRERIFIRCRGQRYGSRGRRFIRRKGKRDGSMGSMSDMISVLHQIVEINSKGGDC